MPSEQRASHGSGARKSQTVAACSVAGAAPDKGSYLMNLILNFWNSANRLCIVAIAAHCSFCSFAQPNNPQPARRGNNTENQAPDTSTKNQSQTKANRELQQAIETRLQRNSDVDFHLIDVSVQNGTVTLDGAVDDLLSADLAERIAQTTRGVQSVKNQLQAKPVSRPDRDIKQDIENALLVDPAADSYEVKVDVTKGAVTLTGNVESIYERRLAERITKGIRGVRSVVNQLEYQYDADRMASEIQSDIRSRLQNDVRLNGENLNVKVEGNVAYLSGSVKSALDKYHATIDAWVNGVQWVDADEVKIQTTARRDSAKPRRTQSASRKVKEPSDSGASASSQSGSANASPPTEPSSPGSPRSDAAIRDAVKNSFLYDPRVYSFNPDVEVSNGTVTLTGIVENAKAKRAAERDARNIVGVERVRNLLKVRTSNPPTDLEIRKNVQDAIHRTTRLNDDEILISVLNGKVTLYGTVDTFLERAMAEDAALGVKGVLDLKNNIGVPTYADEYSSGYTLYGYPDHWASWNWLGDGDSWKSDPELKQDIEDQLFWSPYVDADQVQVSVNGGIVTLSGTVDSLREQSSAIKNAYDGGAVAVNDHLSVSYEGDPLF